MFTPEMIQKSKAAASAEELAVIAKENGIEMSAEEAAAYFAKLHPATGELSDDELDNVAGGGCYARDGRLVVTVGHQCRNFGCKACGADGTVMLGGNGEWSEGYLACAGCKTSAVDCNRCRYCSYEGGRWLCNNPRNSR